MKSYTFKIHHFSFLFVFIHSSLFSFVIFFICCHLLLTVSLIISHVIRGQIVKQVVETMISAEKLGNCVLVISLLKNFRNFHGNMQTRKLAAFKFPLTLLAKIINILIIIKKYTSTFFTIIQIHIIITIIIINQNYLVFQMCSVKIIIQCVLSLTKEMKQGLSE